MSDHFLSGDLAATSRYQLQDIGAGCNRYQGKADLLQSGGYRLPGLMTRLTLMSIEEIVRSSSPEAFSLRFRVAAMGLMGS